jgi:hypothetical protein
MHQLSAYAYLSDFLACSGRANQGEEGGTLPNAPTRDQSWVRKVGRGSTYLTKEAAPDQKCMGIV